MTISAIDYGLSATAAEYRQKVKEQLMVASSMPGMAMPQGAGMTPNYSSLYSITDLTNFADDGFLNDPNGPPSSSKWTTTQGSFTINGGQLGQTGSQDVMYFSGSGAFYPDQDATILIGSLPLDGSCQAVGVRIQTSGWNGYAIYACGRTTQTITLYKFVNGAKTWLSGVTHAFATGDLLTLRVKGTTLTPLYNDSASALNMAVTDTTYSTGYPGIMATSNGGGIQGFHAAGVGGVQLSGTVSGTTIINGSPGNATHAASVQNELVDSSNHVIAGGVSTMTPRVTPQTYINYNYTVTYNVDQWGGLYTGWFGDWVNCSVDGNFFNGNGPGGAAPTGNQTESAVTISKNSKQIQVDPSAPPWSGYFVTPACVTDLPDWDPKFIGDAGNDVPPLWWGAFDYFKSRAFCVRPAGSPVGTPWSCGVDDGVEEVWYEVLPMFQAQFNFEILPPTGNYVDYYCTESDRGWVGPPWNTWP